LGVCLSNKNKSSRPRWRNRPDTVILISFRVLLDYPAGLLFLHYPHCFAPSRHYSAAKRITDYCGQSACDGNPDQRGDKQDNGYSDNQGYNDRPVHIAPSLRQSPFSCSQRIIACDHCLIRKIVYIGTVVVASAIIPKTHRSIYCLCCQGLSRYPRAKPVVLHNSSFACPESWRSWYSTYFSILPISTPTVETKNPGDQTTFSLQYRLCSQPNFFLNSLLVRIFSCATTSLTAYLGGMIITMCMWSGCMLYLIISQSGICSSIFGKSFSRYAFTPGFRMRCRYFGIHTMWYSVRYAVWPDSRISTHPFYYLISPSHTFTHGHSPWNSALRVL